MKLSKCAIALLAQQTLAGVPSKCIIPIGGPTGANAGQQENIVDSVAEIAGPTTHFFGLRACTDKVSNRLVYIQFYLKSDDSEELQEMPPVGPVLSEDVLDCKRRKLEQTDFWVNTVKVYTTELGVEAIRFEVGEQWETFGVASEDAVETPVEFSEDLQLTSVSGFASFSGIKSIQFSSLDQDCVKRNSEKSEAQAKFDTALKVGMKDSEQKVGDNLRTTLMVSFITLFALAGILWLLCFVYNNRLAAKIDLPYITIDEQDEGKRQWVDTEARRKEQAKGGNANNQAPVQVQDYDQNDDNIDRNSKENAAENVDPERQSLAQQEQRGRNEEEQKQASAEENVPATSALMEKLKKIQGMSSSQQEQE